MTYNLIIFIFSQLKTKTKGGNVNGLHEKHGDEVYWSWRYQV